MSIVYFGTADFAVPALEAVSPEVALVVTQPDRPSGRGLKMQPSPVKRKAFELGLPVETPEKARDADFIERIERLSPDFLLVAAYGQILPPRLLESGKQGGINLHGSILPKYRGAAPIQRALLNGDAETGITLMQMDKGMDTGDIIDIRTLPILPDQTYGELQDRLSEMAAQMAAEWLPRLKQGVYSRTPQPSEGASIASKVTKDEAELRFTEPIESSYNRFRAFTPSPGAYLQTKFGRVRLAAAHRAPAGPTPAPPGTVHLPDLVAFSDGYLELVEVQPEGKKRMTGRDFFNGLRLRTGDVLIDGSS